MANQSATIAEVFYSLADPTRIAIVRSLVRGPATVTELAEPFAMALPSFMKHLAILERNGVIRSNKVGRVRTCELQTKKLSQAEQWLATQRETWETRSDRLSAFVENFHQENLASATRKHRKQ